LGGTVVTLKFIVGDSEFILDEDHGIRHLVGGIGMDAASADTTVEPYLTHDGAARTHARRPYRTMLLPLLFRDEAVRKDFTATVVKTSKGTLGQLVDMDSDRRLLDVMYVGGLEGDDSRAMRLTDQWRKAVVELAALDPYWYGVELSVSLPVTAETTMDAAVMMDEPIPMDGGAWSTLTIYGDEPPDGYVTLTGPITRYTFGDLTGQWTLRSALADGVQVIVDSRPQSYGPRLPGGAVDWTLVDNVSTVHSLAADKRVVIGATSSGAATAVFTYRPRWLAPS